MSERKNCYYDVVGPIDKIYTQHFVSDGFVQDWLHFHSKYELTLVLSGDLDIVSSGREYKISKPHIRLHKPYSFHTANARTGEKYECFVFYFTEDSLKGMSENLDLRKLFSEELSISEIHGDKLECAKSLSQIVLLDVSEKMKQLALLGLLSLAEENMSSASKLFEQSDEIKYIQNVLSAIDSNLSSKITAAELAKKAFVSEQKLCADFKNVMNETLHHYIVSARIAHSAMLIAKGRSPLSAALECGFVDETHFSKTFKNRMGMTPSKFSKTIEKSLEYPGDFDPKNTVVNLSPPPVST